VTPAHATTARKTEVTAQHPVTTQQLVETAWRENHPLRREGADPARDLQAITMAKAPSEKTLDELAQDMHTRADGLTHLMAKAEMELRRTSAQLRAVSYMRAASVAAAVSAASAAIAAGAAAYVAFLGR
jgi:septal ring factor EnvC (AmiA/AmiB activator)